MKDQINQAGRKALHAGAGALAEGKEQAVDKVDDFYVTASAFIGSLIERGVILEAELKQKWQETVVMDPRVQSLKSKLGLPKSNSQQLDELTVKVDSLMAAVTKLADKKAAKQTKLAAEPRAPRKTAVSKTTRAAKNATATKPATKTANKPAVKPAAKSVPRKTTARAASKAESF